MADRPDVRALRFLLSPWANGGRPRRCGGCPLARSHTGYGRFLCDLLPGLPEVADAEPPPCTAEEWGERARAELAALVDDSASLAVLAAVARDAREESSMYHRGLAEGAAAERGACCKAVCPDCATGQPVSHRDGMWLHPAPDPGTLLRRCRADAIRRRAGEDGR